MRRDKQKPDNRALHFMIPCVQMLVDLLKERQQDQGYTQSLRSVHLSMSRGSSVANGYNLCLKNYMWGKKFVRDRKELPSLVQCVLVSDKPEPGETKRNIFFDCQQCVERICALRSKMLQLFSLGNQKNLNETKYLFLQYIECTPALNEMFKELRYLRLSWSTTDREASSAIAKKKLK